MAEITENWDIRPLTLQCWVAQATMLDEFQDNKEGALSVLEEALAAVGDDVLLRRATAKIYWRHLEYRKSLEIFRDIAGQVSILHPVEHAEALREAGISAGQCDEWPQAEVWFLDAQRAASRALGDNMKVMEIGLGADSQWRLLSQGTLVGHLHALRKRWSPWPMSTRKPLCVQVTVTGSFAMPCCGRIPILRKGHSE